jgi:hypothetical protein
MILSMKKLFALFSAVLICAATAIAAPPGQVVKVDATNITLHWTHQMSGISKHGNANGNYGGGSRQFTYKLTPKTTYWQGGMQAALSSIQKGAMVQVTADHGVASRIDIQ